MKLRDSLQQNQSILLRAQAQNWQEAIQLGVDLLIKAKVVEPRYLQAIFDNVMQYGPYFLLCPGLAMPHARPEQGVIRTGFALVTLQQPVFFGDADNDPIDILITMAASDATTHQTIGIIQIVNLFDEATSFAQLRACRSAEQVYTLIDSINAKSER